MCSWLKIKKEFLHKSVAELVDHIELGQWNILFAPMCKASSLKKSFKFLSIARNVSGSFHCISLNSCRRSCKSQRSHSGKVITVFVFARFFLSSFRYCLSVMELLKFYIASVYSDTLCRMPRVLASCRTSMSKALGLRNRGKLGVLLERSPSWLLFLHLLVQINTFYHYSLCKTSNVHAWQANPSERLGSSPDRGELLFLFLINIKCTSKPEPLMPKGVCSKPFSSMWCISVSRSASFNTDLIFLWNSLGLDQTNPWKWKSWWKENILFNNLSG